MSAQPKSTLSYYYGSLIAWVLAVVAGYFIGGVQAAECVLFLSMLEIALSFDNAAVNAKILENWDHRWRQIFLTVGILVAVVGMRMLFPLLVVTVSTGINPVAAMDLALEDPARYATIMTSVHHQVSGFGAAFLLMVALNFFFEEKETYWIGWIEERIARFGALEGVAGALTLVGMLVASRFFSDATHGTEFLIAGVWGLVTYIVAHGISTFAGGDEDEGGSTIIKASIGGFLYIELLDASFSFDGVIGAFAVTNYLPLIILGLGVGALFVRSMTIHLVETGVMSEYRYLEHGALYAILALAAMMIVSAMGHEIPEWVSGSVGFVILGAALLHSIAANKADDRTERTQANPGTISA